MNRDKNLENVWKWMEEKRSLGGRIFSIAALLCKPSWRGWWFPLVWWIQERYEYEEFLVWVECLVLLRAVMVTMGETVTVLGTILDALWWIIMLDRLPKETVLLGWMDLSGVGAAFKELKSLAPRDGSTTSSSDTTLGIPDPSDKPDWRTVFHAHGHHMNKGIKLWVRRKMLSYHRGVEQWYTALWMLLAMWCVPGLWRMAVAAQFSYLLVEYVHSLPCVPPENVVGIRDQPRQAVVTMVGSVPGLNWEAMRSKEVRKMRGMQGPSREASLEHLRILEQSLQEVFKISPSTTTTLETQKLE